jgi:23S rRNA (guanine2445-N2)-methyltransferase / 23S rRNA (guanine2069-N7)-methyltransferase
MNIFVSCAIGLEPVLADEIAGIAPDLDVRPTKAGVWVEGTLETAYRTALWSRVASRVLLPLFEAEANVDSLYHAAVEQDWSQHIRPGATLAIDFSGKNKHIRHTRFGALKIKDAIADWHTARELQSPRLEKENPEIRLSARISHGQVSVALDLSGSAMHRRGYRTRQGEAPLRENLAAALLYRAGWPDMAAGNKPLFDPMCGSGTLVIEAAMMALDIAPGLRREHWGFDRWPGHDSVLWHSLLREATQRWKDGRERYKGRIYGSDANAYMMKMARDNASRAGVQDVVEFQTADVTQVSAPVDEAGLLITNPPYGERLGDEAEVALLYEKIGENLLANFSGWKAAVLAANAEFGRRMGIHSYKQYRVDNGNLACLLLLFDVSADSKLGKKREAEPSEGARMVANRIKKNMARMNSWLSCEEITAFRAYDADLPEYAAAVDLYQTESGRYAVVQEYAPPKTVDPAKARHRLNELVTGVGLSLSVGPDKIHLKSRERQRGSAQYQSHAGGRFDDQADEPSDTHWVREGRATIEVNLEDYLDTGLFLDHRPIRREIFKMASGKSFLNLFCYTSVVTVQAALGGAKRSLSVDMSNTYLDWSERNFRQNHLDLNRHRLLREDCLKFLHLQSLAPEEKFDLIFLDPPSFSNSKRMEEVLDIQRDHVRLIEQSMRLLRDDGLLIFSTNLRNFKMDTSALERFDLEDHTQASLDPDFQRNQRIHQCWKLRHRL